MSIVHLTNFVWKQKEEDWSLHHVEPTEEEIPTEKSWKSCRRLDLRTKTNNTRTDCRHDELRLEAEGRRLKLESRGTNWRGKSWTEKSWQSLSENYAPAGARVKRRSRLQSWALEFLTARRGSPCGNWFHPVCYIYASLTKSLSFWFICPKDVCKEQKEHDSLSHFLKPNQVALNFWSFHPGEQSHGH